MGFWFVFFLGWIGWGFRIPYALNLVFPAVRGWAALWIVLVQDFFKFLIILVFALLLKNFLVHTLRPFLESLEKKHDLAKPQVKKVVVAPPIAAAPMVAEAATAVVVEKVLSDGDKNMLKSGEALMDAGEKLLGKLTGIALKTATKLLQDGKLLVAMGEKALLAGGKEALKWGKDAATWGLKVAQLTSKGIKEILEWGKSGLGWSKKASASGEAASKDQTKEYS